MTLSKIAGDLRIPLVATTLLALAGCNTIGGFGEDVSTGGEAISDTAQDAENEIEG
jgi:predicted small secreted protein